MPSNHSHYLFLAVALSCATAGRAQITLNKVPTREIGHPQLLSDTLLMPNHNPNLVEGRELYNPAGVAVDNSVTPLRIYVADTGNNRILAWKDAVGFTNGKPADLVIGQRDFFSTDPKGPGTTLSTGLFEPTGLAVDQGDLYVTDSGNNRILRFRKPFGTPPDQLVPDLCLGQPSFNTNGPNYPINQAGKPSDKGIALNTGGGNVFVGALTFDAQHNLWFTDAGNRRVLRYPKSALDKGGFATTISADLEIGQRDFPFLDPSPTAAQAGQVKDLLATPAAIAFDAKGNLYVADSDGGTAVNRVLVFVPSPGFTLGMKATRVMGIQAPPVAGVTPPDSQVYSIAMFQPSAIFFLPGTQAVGVIDAGYSRIMMFDPYDQWPADVTVSPSAKAIFGHTSGIAGIVQTDAKSLFPNDGNPQAAALTIARPQGAAFDSGRSELYVADTANNRVVVLPLQGGNFGAAVRVLGQDRLNTNSINLIEGKEFFFFNPVSRGADAAVVMDSTGDTPHMYVADPNNHRVLGFRDVRKLIPGSAADIVIGQPDLATALCNYPTGDPNQPSQSSLCHPIGLLVDGTGNLYVADNANGRVLRFPTPFSHQGNQLADLVLGKANFTTPPFTNVDQFNMLSPYGLAFAGNNGLLVSDQTLNRMLYIPFSANGTFTSADNGKAASKVFGQPDFVSAKSGATDTGMSSPHHISSDTDGRPYVVDSGNNRVLIYDAILNNPSAGAHAFPLPAGNAQGIFVNSNTGDVWITDSGGPINKFPRYDQLVQGFGATFSAAANNPIAVTQDQFGDLVVAEAFNRVTFYYPSLFALNAAVLGLANRSLAPDTIATIVPAGIQFGKDTADAFSQAKPLPLPTTMADVQVNVNGTAAPLYFVSPTQINFVMPWNAPTTGTADVQVMKVSTGQLLAASAVPMNTVSPAIFVGSSAGTGAKLAAVINQDNTVNDAAHPAKVGEYIAIYATGQGLVSNPPADGDIPRNGVVGGQGLPRVFIGTDYTDQIPLLPNEQRSIPGTDNNFIAFSGLSPNFPGMWQINVRIPKSTAGGAQALGLLYNSVPDNTATITGYRVVFYVASQ